MGPRDKPEDDISGSGAALRISHCRVGLVYRPAQGFRTRAPESRLSLRPAGMTIQGEARPRPF
jgi:hypothetical protein